MSSFIDLEPEALAKRAFLIVMASIAAIIVVVVLLNVLGNSKTPDAVAPAVEILAQAR
jgi:hypothetical protein